MKTQTTLLIVDDDPEIRQVIRIFLEGDGFQIVEAENGDQALQLLRTEIELIILDIMMPGKSGFVVCSEMRKITSAPILFLSAKSDESDKALGFSAGGDDFIVKPFSYTELLLRVKALLRRYQKYGSKEIRSAEEVIQIKDLSISTLLNSVIKNGHRLELTELEYQILLLLAKTPNKIFTIENIYESIWQEPYYYTSNNTVMVHIRNLRKKLQDESGKTNYIINIWGRGYKIDYIQKN